MKHRSLVQQLLLHGTIETSEAKAKAIKGFLDKVINQAKNKKNYTLVTRETLLKLKNRTSGYTSLTKLGPRAGDGAMMVRMSLLLEKVKSKK